MMFFVKIKLVSILTLSSAANASVAKNICERILDRPALAGVFYANDFEIYKSALLSAYDTPVNAGENYGRNFIEPTKIAGWVKRLRAIPVGAQEHYI